LFIETKKCHDKTMMKKKTNIVVLKIAAGLKKGKNRG